MSKLPQLDTSITFSDSGLEGCQHPHDDPLVVRAIVANKTVHRVLVNNGSLADIIFASAFDKMGIGRERLEPVNTHLRGFSGEKVLPLGSIQLVLTLGEPSCQAKMTARFLIVDAPSAYNMLLGRPSLKAIKAIPSAYHMMIKFPTVHRVGMVRGDQRVARECYTTSMKQKAVDNVYMDELDMRDEVLTRPEPSEELEPVSLDDDPKEAAKIRTRSARFTNHKGSLYKRGFFTPILKCIAEKDTEYVLTEVHEGIWGNHIGARALAGKVLRQGYYWPTILKDATDLVKKRRIFQEHAKISRLPSEPLTSTTSPWPFQQWGLDILGPLPLGKGQCKFIIVVVDYFTKWAKDEPLATITE